MTDEDARRLQHRFREHRVEILDDVCERPRTGIRLAPGEPRAILRAHPRKRRNPRLHVRPAQRRCRNAGFKEDRGPAAGRDGVEAPSADVDRRARHDARPRAASRPDQPGTARRRKRARGARSRESPHVACRYVHPKIFCVGIRARIRSSSSTVMWSRPLFRQDSSTALTTMPRTNAGIFFMRAAASSSQAIVVGDSGPYWSAGIPAPPRRMQRPWMARRGDPANVPGVWVQRGLRPSNRRSSRRPGRGSPRSGRSSRTPRNAPERCPAADVGEQLRGRPEVRETRAAKSPREDREVRARGDISVRPYPHVVRPRRAPAGASGVGPYRGRRRACPSPSGSLSRIDGRPG